MKSLHKTLTHILSIILIITAFGCGNSSSGPMAPDSDFDESANLSAMNDNVNSDATSDSNLRNAQITWNCFDENLTEPNHDPILAVEAGHGDIWSGHVDYDTDVNDFYRIDLTEPADPMTGAIYARLEWVPGAELNLYLRGENLEILKMLEFDGTNDHEFLETGLKLGTYYIQVACFVADADYSIKFAAAYEYLEPANDSAVTTPWNTDPASNPSYIYDSSENVLRSVLAPHYMGMSTGDHDYLQIQVPQNAKIRAELDWVALEGSTVSIRVYKINGSTSNPIGLIYTGVAPLSFETDKLNAGLYAIKVRVTGKAIYELDVKARLLLEIDPSIFNRYLIPRWTLPGPGPVIEIIDDPVIRQERPEMSLMDDMEMPDFPGADQFPMDGAFNMPSFQQ